MIEWICLPLWAVHKAIGVTCHGVPVVLFFVQFVLYHFYAHVDNIRFCCVKLFCTISQHFSLFVRQANLQTNIFRVLYGRTPFCRGHACTSFIARTIIYIARTIKSRGFPENFSVCHSPLGECGLKSLSRYKVFKVHGLYYCRPGLLLSSLPE